MPPCAGLTALLKDVVAQELQKYQENAAIAQAMSTLKDQADRRGSGGNFYDFLGVDQASQHASNL